MTIQKIQKGWQELEEEVIKSNKCVYCGACGAFCLNIRFDKDKEVPIEDGSCEEMNTCRDGYGVCYNLCPKTATDVFSTSVLDNWVFGKDQDQILGHYIDIVSVKVSETAREKVPMNAGPITSLLTVAMENGYIDSAIVTGKDEKFSPYPYIAVKPEDLKDSIGYKPSQSPTLSLIGEAINKEYTDIAVVGTPCQIHALRKLENHPRFDFEAYDLVSLAIGTFCFGTFHNQRLNEILSNYNINPAQIEAVETDHHQFKMLFRTTSEKIEVPLNELYDDAIREACFECSDYTSSFADLSVGTVGSEDEWSTLIIRTQRGKEIFDLAVEEGFLETRELGKESEEIILDLTRRKTDIVKIEKVIEHSPEIKSFIVRNERIAKAYRPGNFVILWLPDVDFLPMSISKVEGNQLEITVQKIGEGTKKLFEMNEGDTIGIRGPFGNSWNYEDAQNILIIGGGMGIAAITSLIEPLKQNKKDVTVTIGAKDEASLIFSGRLMELIPNTMCTTDDGSVGKKCFVTEEAEQLINENNYDLILTCGPEVMMKRVLEIAENKGIPIQASLERKMKCGIGLCGSCCVGEENDICVCKEGPIFTSVQLKKFPQFGTYSK